MTEKELKNFIQNALKEDVGDGDHTSLASIPASATNKAHLLIKDDGIIAGIELAKMICTQVDPLLTFSFKVQDGEFVNKNTPIGSISGSVQSILKLERLFETYCLENVLSDSQIPYCVRIIPKR